MMKTFLLCVVIPLCFCESKEIPSCSCECETIENCSELLHSNRSFVIDNDNNVFLKDGKPFNYISGELHYFRIPRAYWRDRMQKLKAAGLNAISMSVEWSTHEPCPGKFNFDGEADIEHFLRLATDENLLVILRPGAWIHAERDFGGLPPWLLTLYPNIKSSSHDPDFLHEVEKWFDKLFNRIKKYLYGNGGPIIMVQVDNGNGYEPRCNMDYKIFIRDLFKKLVRDAAVLFTIDSSECGHIPGIHTSTAFAPGVNVTQQISEMRKFSPRGPFINSEFYVGWFSCWGENTSTLPDTSTLCDTTAMLKTTKELLDLKANFNFFMFAGGTNFGFKNGAEFGTPPGETHKRYRTVLTSYNYGAPIDEAGDYTLKYHAIRSLISEYHEEPLPDLPNPSPKGEYGKVRLESALSIFNAAFIKDKVVINAEEPKTFEELNVKYGYMLYETQVPDNVAKSAKLFVKEVRDRAIIFLNQVPVGILSRRSAKNTSSLPTASGKKLSILIENQGRYPLFGPSKDNFKGLLSTPTLNDQPLKNWTMTGLPFGNILWVHDSPKSTEEIKPPALYVGELILPPRERPKDTFVDLTGWGKGVIFINNVNIGRYWPCVGSQVTLYVPGYYLRASPQKNTIVVFETDYTPENKEIVFRDKAILEK